MATAALPELRIDRTVEPIRQCSQTVPQLLAERKVLRATLVLLYLVFLAKRARIQLKSIEAKLHHFDAIPDEELPKVRSNAAKMGQTSQMSRESSSACRSILASTTTHHQMAIRLLVHPLTRVLAEDLEWLDERLEDLAEILALSSHKPFTDLVHEELSHS